VRDRFARLEPSVFLAVDGYRYGERSTSGRVRALRQQLPSLTATVLVPYLDPAARA
jgi:acetoacetyl-CoA synthetase